ILTNVGMAHIAAFADRRHLAREKLSLFARAAATGWLLLPDGDAMVADEASRLPCRLVRYPADPVLPCLVARRVVAEAAGGGRGGHEQSPGFAERLEIRFPSGRVADLAVRTRSAEIVEDVMLAVGAAWLLGISEERIAESLGDYAPPPTRLEVW